MRRIARRLRALWHRRELRWVLAELGLADLDQLAALPRDAASRWWGPAGKPPPGCRFKRESPAARRGFFVYSGNGAQPS